MVAPNPLAARRRTNSSSFSVAVPSSWEESVVSGAMANRFAISRPLLNLKGDQTTIDQTSRAFSSEVGTGSREENASKQKTRAPFRFQRNGKALVKDASGVDDDGLAG